MTNYKSRSLKNQDIQLTRLEFAILLTGYTVLGFWFTYTVITRLTEQYIINGGL